jgi:hypothetical protein
LPALPAGAPRQAPAEALTSLPGLTGFAAAGLLTDNAFGLERELVPGGALVEVRTPPEGWERAARWKGHHEGSGDRLRRVERWLIPDTGEVARELGDGFLLWRCEDRDGEPHLVLERRDEARSTTKVGPRLSRRACAGLSQAALVLDGTRGALVDVAGRIVRFDADEP